MPDAYTSQFSGEEIDAAVRAAQIISGASTLAELRKKLEIRGDTIPVSAEDSTLISEALTKIPTTSGGGVNPNLLDNWYFGRPVNQRNGYYIPAGVKYNTLSWTEAGTTDKAYPVIGYSGQDPLIAVNGTNYIVGKSAQVPGYCVAGYTIDRWKLDVGGAVTLEDDCICLKKSGTYWGEYFADFDQFIGMTLTGSVLLSDGTLRTGSFVYNGSVNQAQTFFSSELGFYIQKLSNSQTQCEIHSLVDNVKIKAAKLELGGEQTLAHKKNGVWVLTEIPDFGDQLRRCQRYCVDVTPSLTFNSMYGGTLYPTGCDFLVPIPVTLRESGSAPAVICNPSEWQVAVVAANAYFTPTSINVSQTASGAVSLRCLFSHSLSSQYCDFRKATDSAKLILSKDL